MSLKDLIADASKLDEGAIESVIAPFVKYDPSAERIIFTPSGVALSHENKVLVYLTAVAGWPFVSDTPPEHPTKPADLGSALGIPGGSLRPVLKKLKDLHLLANDAGHYSIQSANLTHIEAYVKGESKPSKRRPPAKHTSRSNANSDKTKVRSKKQRGGGSASDAFEDLVGHGFFKSPRTLANLKNKLEDRGLIFPQSALSGLVLKAVRQNVLKREKIESDGRKVWAYSDHE
ncbi:hypothetical protein FSZ31_02935 [Sphingorhabdus soli]|uniref:Uncharacterized protein n=1 Tax=Flavisphingopyxis soli TaxID=2601267 RepID=A0A5C6UMC8_9SPHN|nr:hypothetical protein [Sphingorhabdus soli]TXC73704.1 hypothetical protein FSZ31_02935 [Sphingorhabdus soli]